MITIIMHALSSCVYVYMCIHSCSYSKYSTGLCIVFVMCSQPVSAHWDRLEFYSAFTALHVTRGFVTTFTMRRRTVLYCEPRLTTAATCTLFQKCSRKLTCCIVCILLSVLVTIIIIVFILLAVFTDVFKKSNNKH